MSAETLPTDRLIGEVLAQRYEILHRLGEGAMGAVYKARHVKVGRSFAVKVLHARVLEDAKVVKRFEREAELAGRLRHANVVGVVDVGEIDGMRYMVMDYAEGPDLAQLLDEAPMPPVRIIHIVRQLLEGLYHAHEQGLIHRDFKPENVIVERDSHGAELPRIVDFGIAILRDGGAGVDQQGRLTTNGLVLGTPHYMAPEQAVADPIDHRIDLFALGIVVYEMLSGRLPYDGNGAEVARANLLLDPPPIIQRVPYLEVDPLLEAFARRLMAKKRDARPPTAKAARELLDLIERDRPAAAAALGLSPSMSTRGPALTEPVHPQATTSMRSPGVASPINAPRIAIDPRAPIDQREIETSRRVPLGWESTPPPPRSRTPWFVGGGMLGAAGIVLAIALTRGAPDASVEPSDPGENRVVMTPVDPAPAPPAAADPTSTAPTPAAPTAAAQPPPSAPGTNTAGSDDPLVVIEPASDPAAMHRATEPIAVSDHTDDVSASKRSATRDGRDATQRGRNVPKTGDVRTGNARAADTRAADARTGNARSGDAKTGDVRTGDVPSGNARSSDAKTGDVRTGDVPSGNARSGNAKTGDVRTGDVPTGNARSSDAKNGDVRTGDVSSGNARSGNAKTGDAKAGDAKTGDAKATKPVAKPQKVTGLTANEISELYASVGRELSALPGPSAQDLWSRLLLIKIQELMAAPQAKRDEAARQLQLIHQEAVLRKP